MEIVNQLLTKRIGDYTEDLDVFTLRCKLLMLVCLGYTGENKGEEVGVEEKTQEQ